MTIDWWTLAFQAINFLILAWLLQRFLYRPVIGILDRRRRESEAAATRLEQARQQAESQRDAFEAKQRELVAERDRTVQETRAQLERERQEVIAAARRESEAILAGARQALEEERQQALDRLFDRSLDLSTEIAARLLQQTGIADADGALFERLVDHLNGLSADQRASLLAPADGTAQVRVVTAHPLDDAARRRWRERLAAALGDGAQIVFDSGADLLAGAELRFPHATLRFTWRGALDDLRRELAAKQP
jgi:F-type H+-transporting ATPase subunit b